MKGALSLRTTLTPGTSALAEQVERPSRDTQRISVSTARRGRNCVWGGAILIGGAAIALVAWIVAFRFFYSRFSCLIRGRLFCLLYASTNRYALFSVGRGLAPAAFFWGDRINDRAMLLLCCETTILLTRFAISVYIYLFLLYSERKVDHSDNILKKKD